MKNTCFLTFLLWMGCAGFSGCSTSSQNFQAAEQYVSKETQVFTRGMGELAVASQGRYSTEAAMEISKAGGNTVDVAVAMSFVISVERPFSSGLGGGGFLLVNIPEKGVEAWDFRERAPLRSDRDMFLNIRTGEPDPDKSRKGANAVAVPGLVKGLYELHQKHGQLPWRRLLQPAIDLAQRGMPVYPSLARALKATEKDLRSDPAARKIFFDENGEVWKEGDLLVQKDLARVLRHIAEDGGKSFYRGWIAEAMVKTLRSQGGRHSMKDFASYRVKMRKPVVGEIAGHTIYTMPPPSSGGTHLLQILNTVEKDPIGEWGALDPRSIHLTSAAMQKAFIDRAHYMGDPDFVEVPTQKLSSKKYAQWIRSKISLDRAKKSEEWTPGPLPQIDETDHTIHFSLMSRDGTAIASTQTINGWFGAKIVAEGTGIVMNNEMDDFSAAIGAKNLFGATASSEANLVAPKKTPLSSMTPTLVFEDDKAKIALGTPSGTRILTCVSQVLANRLIHKMQPLQAVSQIRYHHQATPDEIRVDEPGFPVSVERDLEKMGYKINKKNLGCVIQYVELDSKSGEFTAVSDPRGEAWTAVNGVDLPWKD